jgi:cell division ATPase FtsA
MVFKKLQNMRKENASNDYIVGLDIGTEYVKALVAKLDGATWAR